MTLLYQPSSSGHWQHTTDDERDSTYDAVSDLLGVRMSVKPEQPRLRAEQPVKTVQLQGQKYRVPDPCSKQFYRELTYLSDEEIVEKYGLVPCKAEDYRKSRRMSIASKSSAGSSVRTQ